MASRRIYVTIMVDINNDELDEIDDEKVADIANRYTDYFTAAGCEVEASLCDWVEK